MDLKTKAQKLKTDIPTVFLALKKKNTPLGAKILAIIIVLYALSPLDLIPDFIPIFGYLDDIILLPLLIGITIKLIPQDILDQCRVEANNLWINGKPKRWYYSIPIVLLWVLILYIIIKTFYQNK